MLRDARGVYPEVFEGLAPQHEVFVVDLTSAEKGSCSWRVMKLGRRRRVSQKPQKPQKPPKPPKPQNWEGCGKGGKVGNPQRAREAPDQRYSTFTISSSS